MSKNIDLLDERIAMFLTELHASRNRIRELEETVKDLKKDASHQRSLAKKYREESAALRKELQALKNEK